MGGSAGGTGMGFSGGSAGGNSNLGGSTGSTSNRTGSNTNFSSGSTNNIPGTTNPFRAHYTNPLSVGLPGGSGRSTFGTPLYTVTNTPTATATINTNSSAANASASSIGVIRAPAYITTIGFDFQPLAATRVQADLKDVFARSTQLIGKDKIQIRTEGNAVVLEGTVVSEKERRLAEGMVRLTPGVREVRNELRIQAVEPAPAAKASP